MALLAPTGRKVGDGKVGDLLSGPVGTNWLERYAVALLPPTGWKDLYVNMLWNLAVGLEWASCIEKWFFCSENLLF